MSETREYALGRDPDAILRQIAEAEKDEGAARGKLKVFFGYAAGVGKTYAMLEAAHAAQNMGFDVAVGYVEPHTRADTMALLDGLECLPTLDVQHRGIALHEFDLDAALARRPQILLVDEFAHTNAPGRRHRKRYQDIDELLRAGINVFTTVNVQHLESLNDKVAAITHVAVAERIPDRVFDDADAVELVDIEPSDLIERLEAGKVYVPQRAQTALANFFTPKNLASLREIALRRMTERLARRAERAGAAAGGAGSAGAAGDGVLVHLCAELGNMKAVRFAARLAKVYDAPLVAVAVETSLSKADKPERKARLRANAELAEEMGAQVVTLHGDDVARQLAQYADAAGIAHIVVGDSSTARLAPFRETLPHRLARLSHNAAIEVVPTADLPAQYGRLREGGMFRFSAPDVGKALLAVAAASAIGMAVYDMGLTSAVIPMLYMLVVFVVARFTDSFTYALVASIGSMLAYNFFFSTPRFTFSAYGLSYPFVFACIFAGTFVVSSLAIRAKRQTESMARRAYRMEVLLESSRKMQRAVDVDACFSLAADQVVKLTECPVVTYRMGDDGRLLAPVVHDAPGADATRASGATRGVGGERALTSDAEAAVAAWVAANNERAGVTTDTLATARCLYVPIADADKVHGVLGIALSADDLDGEDDALGSFEKNLMLMIVDECAQVSSRLSLLRERRLSELKAEKETLRSNLLRTIAHDLRTPLTSISGDASMLLSDEGQLDAERRRLMYADIHADAEWLVMLVENLLSITRIDNGSMDLNLQPELLSDVLSEALLHVDHRAKQRSVSVDVADELLMASIDARLVVQVVINLVNNAVAHTDEGGRIAVAARALEGAVGEEPRVVVTVTDDGPGVAEADRERIFDLFYNGANDAKDAGAQRGDHRRGMGLGLALCRSIVEAHGGVIGVRGASPHGSEFWFTLPSVDARAVVAGGE